MCVSWDVCWDVCAGMCACLRVLGCWSWLGCVVCELGCASWDVCVRPLGCVVRELGCCAARQLGCVGVLGCELGVLGCVGVLGWPWDALRDVSWDTCLVCWDAGMCAGRGWDVWCASWDVCVKPWLRCVLAVSWDAWVYWDVRWMCWDVWVCWDVLGCVLAVASRRDLGCVCEAVAGMCGA